LRDYCLGLLLPGERKSVEPIAAVTAPARVSAKHQSLLHFVANAPWSNERVLSRIQELTVPLIEGSGVRIPTMSPGYSEIMSLAVPT
jgi:SRSO17 transposase